MKLILTVEFDSPRECWDFLKTTVAVEGLSEAPVIPLAPVPAANAPVVQPHDIPTWPQAAPVYAAAVPAAVIDTPVPYPAPPPVEAPVTAPKRRGRGQPDHPLPAPL